MAAKAEKKQAEGGGMPGLSAAEFRRAMGQFATGITVVSTLAADGSPHGMTASSFGSLSLDPPLVQWSLTTKSFSYSIFSAAPHFAVNILAADQEAVSREFGKPVDRFASVQLETGLHGLPLIQGCLAWIECALEHELPGGDHTILVGRVLRCRYFDKTPLIFWRGAYMPVDGWEPFARTGISNANGPGPHPDENLSLL